MNQLWKPDRENNRPRAVDCPDGVEWPARDAESETIYKNSHFKTEDECFDDMESSCLHMIEASVRWVRESEDRLLVKQLEAVKFAKNLVDVRANREAARRNAESEA